jgi:hypothetical protein
MSAAWEEPGNRMKKAWKSRETIGSFRYPGVRNAGISGTSDKI